MRATSASHCALEFVAAVPPGHHSARILTPSARRRCSLPFRPELHGTTAVPAPRSCDVWMAGQGGRVRRSPQPLSHAGCLQLPFLLPSQPAVLKTAGRESYRVGRAKGWAKVERTTCHAQRRAYSEVTVPGSFRRSGAFNSKRGNWRSIANPNASHDPLPPTVDHDAAPEVAIRAVVVGIRTAAIIIRTTPPGVRRS